MKKSIIKKVVEQIGDESLLGASYTETELVTAGFQREGGLNLPTSNDERLILIEVAKVILEEEWGLVCTPEDE